MNRGRHLCLAFVCSLVALPAWADCSLPPAPSKVPDAASASQQEMIAAMQTLKHYDADVNTYLKCLEFEAKQSRLSHDEQARKHNQAVDALAAVAAKFNEQVRIFKAKSS